ncbi:hypothetical protein GCM10010353_65270 [Streptomyces chryseus]|nr:hypothetical protein GCM10010353_65270 [Streptomyces chryseus]
MRATGSAELTTPRVSLRQASEALAGGGLVPPACGRRPPGKRGAASFHPLVVADPPAFVQTSYVNTRRVHMITQ